MSSYRVPTPEELAVLNILADHDNPGGVPDDTLQKLIGRSPVLEAVDQLHEFGLISEAIDPRGKKRPRFWRLTASGEEQRVVQARAVAVNLQARIDAAKVPDEAARLRELVPLVGSASREPEPTTTSREPGQKPAKAVAAKKPAKKAPPKPAPKRRDQPEQPVS